MSKAQFNEQIAAHYDEDAKSMYRSDVIEPTVDFLAELVGNGAALEFGKLRTFSAPFRWVWPAELDLMARLAGMTLRERWAGWNREPFADESDSHVSVWEKLR
jgi:hypothetical protein